MNTIELVVDGMGCRRCVREVTGRLRDVPGVVTVTADATQSRVTLSGTMTAADVLAAFTDAAHPPTIVGDTATTAALPD